ncbi:hypothetical protein GEMRC1_006981 [Eukaryota sp. GEM-RC1]
MPDIPDSETALCLIGLPLEHHFLVLSSLPSLYVIKYSRLSKSKDDSPFLTAETYLLPPINKITSPQLCCTPYRSSHSSFIVTYSFDNQPFCLNLKHTNDTFSFSSPIPLSRLTSPLTSLSLTLNGDGIMYAGDDPAAMFYHLPNEDLNQSDLIKEEKIPKKEQLFVDGALASFGPDEDTSAALITSNQSVIHFPSGDVVDGIDSARTDGQSIGVSFSGRFFVVGQDCFYHFTKSNSSKKSIVSGLTGLIPNPSFEKFEKFEVLVYTDSSFYLVDVDGNLSAEKITESSFNKVIINGETIYFFQKFELKFFLDFSRLPEFPTPIEEDSDTNQTDNMIPSDDEKNLEDESLYYDSRPGEFQSFSSGFSTPSHLSRFDTDLIDTCNKLLPFPFDSTSAQWSLHMGDRPSSSFDTGLNTKVKVLHCSNVGFVRSIRDFTTDEIFTLADHHIINQSHRVPNFDPDLASINSVGLVCCTSPFFSSCSTSVLHFSPFSIAAMEYQPWTIELNESIYGLGLTAKHVIVVTESQTIVYSLSGIPIRVFNQVGVFLTLSSLGNSTVIIRLINQSHLGSVLRAFLVSDDDVISNSDLNPFSSMDFSLLPGICIRWVGFCHGRPSYFDSKGDLFC